MSVCCKGFNMPRGAQTFPYNHIFHLTQPFCTVRWCTYMKLNRKCALRHRHSPRAQDLQLCACHCPCMVTALWMLLGRDCLKVCFVIPLFKQILRLTFLCDGWLFIPPLSVAIWNSSTFYSCWTTDYRNKCLIVKWQWYLITTAVARYIE